MLTVHVDTTPQQHWLCLVMITDKQPFGMEICHYSMTVVLPWYVATCTSHPGYILVVASVDSIVTVT